MAACPLIPGLLLARLLVTSGAAEPHPEGFGVFYYLFAHHEPIHFGILIVLGAALSALFFTGQIARRSYTPAPPLSFGWPFVALLSVAVLASTALGARFVFHGYPLAMDEFAADFQSRVFAAGHVQAAIPNEWIPFANALTPIFVSVSHEGDAWTSAYLPVAAAMRAIFAVGGVPELTNPVLAGLTVPVVWLVGRRLWRDDPAAAWVPTLLLAVSPQFLFTSMTAYAMPAHLLLNMAWLYLYLVGSRAALALAGGLGVLAMGLHQPSVHALFVAPFLLYLVVARRLRAVAFFGTVYVLGAMLWIGWWVRLNPSIGGVPGLLFSPPQVLQLLLQPLNLGLLVSWQSIAMSSLAIVGLMRWRTMSSPLRNLALGLFLTLGFYLFVNVEQGHGWGYRYAYGVLGNLALLAGHGWVCMRESWRQTRGVAFIAASVLCSIVVQIPIRAIQVEAFVRPFADSMAYVRSLSADVALIDRTTAWYATDLVRNDPLLTNRPKVMLRNRLTESQLAALGNMGTVRDVEAAELGRLGLVVSPEKTGGEASLVSPPGTPR